MARFALVVSLAFSKSTACDPLTVRSDQESEENNVFLLLPPSRACERALVLISLANTIAQESLG